MKIEFANDWVLVITPENYAEYYALTQWLLKSEKDNTISEKILIMNYEEKEGNDDGTRR